jgi:hypothetical protein
MDTSFESDSFEPLPLVIGVTGHRDLRREDIKTLTAEIEKIFDRLEDEYANPCSFVERNLRRFWPEGAEWLKLKDKRRKRAGVTPMIVLSALAEGADQLVAQVAYDRGLQVIAPLPLPAKAYRQDFEREAIEPDAARKFDTWMKRAAGDGQGDGERDAGPKPRVQTWFVGLAGDNTLEKAREPGEPRNLQYRHVGQFIARHCDVLIALWDGEPSDAKGGTAEIANYKLNGIPLDASSSPRACLDSPEMGPVIHVVTPRAKKTGAVQKVWVKGWGDELINQYEQLAGQYDRLKKRRDALKKLYDKLVKRHDTNDDAASRRAAVAVEQEKITSEMAKLKEQTDPIQADYQLWKSVEATIRLTRNFNTTATSYKASPKGAAAIGTSFSYLFGIDDSKPETEKAALQGRTVARRYCDLYGVADALAIHWQAQVFRRDWFWLFGLGLTAFGCFEAYSHLASIADSWLLDLALLSGYILSFVAIVALYFWATRWEHQEQFLDYRALAEALRVTVFWRLGGIEGAADAYPIRLPRELAWVKTCLLVQELLDAVTPPGARPALDATSYGWIREIWIKGQGDYFERTRQRHRDNAGSREDWSKWTLLAVAGLAVLLLGLVFSGLIGRKHEAHELFLFAIGFLPGIAAVLVGYCEKLAFNAQARQYERMADVFRRAYKILPPQFNPADAKRIEKVVSELGSEAMRDNAEWVSTYRERPFSLPQS